MNHQQKSERDELRARFNSLGWKTASATVPDSNIWNGETQGRYSSIAEELPESALSVPEQASYCEDQDLLLILKRNGWQRRLQTEAINGRRY